MDKPIDFEAALAGEQSLARAPTGKHRTGTTARRKMSPRQLERRAIWLVLTCALLAGTIAPATTRAQSEPVRIVQDATNRILRLIGENLKSYQSDPASYHKAVEITLAPHFDFQRMSKLVVGNDVWREAGAASQNEFISQFRSLLVRAYGSVLLNYRGQPISNPQVLDKFDSRGQSISDPKVPDREVRVVRVRTKIENREVSQGYYLVDYVFLRGPQGWGVVDVSIDGVSLVTTYSATFKTIVQERGMEGLNTDLRKLNEAAGKGAG